MGTLKRVKSLVAKDWSVMRTRNMLNALQSRISSVQDQIGRLNNVVLLMMELQKSAALVLNSLVNFAVAIERRIHLLTHQQMLPRMHLLTYQQMDLLKLLLAIPQVHPRMYLLTHQHLFPLTYRMESHVLRILNAKVTVVVQESVATLHIKLVSLSGTQTFVM